MCCDFTFVFSALTVSFSAKNFDKAVREIPRKGSVYHALLLWFFQWRGWEVKASAVGWFNYFDFNVFDTHSFDILKNPDMYIHRYTYTTKGG